MKKLSHKNFTAPPPVGTASLPQSTQQKQYYSFSKIWRIAYPILIASLVEQIINLTDTFFLGQLGEVELGASALAGLFFMAVFMPLLGFSVGTQILIGRRNGEQQYTEIGKVFYHSLSFLLTLSVVLLVVVQAFSADLLRMLIHSTPVYEATNDYLYWRMWGIGFSAVACLFRALYVGTTHTSMLKYNSLIMVVGNVLGNYLLIFGHWGCPRMGIAGAAIASSLASLLSLLFFIYHSFRHLDYVRYALHQFPRLRWALFSKMFGLSVWTMIQYTLSISTWFLFFLAVESLGQTQLAASNVLRSITIFIFMVVGAFGSTASTLTSNLLGEGRPQAVLPVIHRCILMAAAFILPITLFIALFPEWTIACFTNSAAVVEMGGSPMWVLCLSYLFIIPGYVNFQAISGTGNTRTALAIEFLIISLYALYIYVVVMQLRWNLTWAWASELLYQGLFVVLACGYMRWGKWSARQL